MDMELTAEREKLMADKILVESELKTVNEDLNDQLTAAKSQVGKLVFSHLSFADLSNFLVCK